MRDEDYREVTCFDIGMAGNCTINCPIYDRGECENAEETEEETEEEIEEKRILKKNW